MSKSNAARGRPRSQPTRDAILEAAFTIMLERGYAGLAVEAVAKAAGAGKTTIYRWWSTRADLAVAAFFHATTDELMLPETASAADDFRRQITDLAGLLRGPRGIVFATMLGGARTDRALAKALGEHWLEPRRAWGFARMSKALAEGQCRDGVDLFAALGILYGPLYTPLLFGQDVPSAAAVDAHLRLATMAIFRS